MPDRLPVVLVTGFLGSGKTTLISALLAHPDMGETVVLVNELGEIAIDHHLVRRVDERTVVLDSGCVCCTLRGDLRDELRDVLDRRARGELGVVPPRRRRDHGLADPAPVLSTLVGEPAAPPPLRREAVVTTVDAVSGAVDARPPRRGGQAGRGGRHARRDEGRRRRARGRRGARGPPARAEPGRPVRRVSFGAIAPTSCSRPRARPEPRAVVPSVSGADDHATTPATSAPSRSCATSRSTGTRSRCG